MHPHCNVAIIIYLGCYAQGCAYINELSSLCYTRSSCGALAIGIPFTDYNTRLLAIEHGYGGGREQVCLAVFCQGINGRGYGIALHGKRGQKQLAATKVCRLFSHGNAKIKRLISISGFLQDAVSRIKVIIPCHAHSLKIG